MIEIDRLTKKYGEKTAVEDLTLRVEAGECFAFLGPNGAGKTTTIKVLAGLLRPTSGRVTVCGHDMVSDSMAAKARLAYVPDEPYLYDKLSGREFLLFVAEMYGIGPQDTERRIAHYADLFGLHGYIDDLCEGYSHGMKQRVVLTAALLHEPEVIVVDEPMVGLDPSGARLVKDLFRRHAADGLSVFLSTHSLSIAEEVADRIGIIHQGRLISLGTLKDLRAKCGGEGGLEEMFLQIVREAEGGGGASCPSP